MKRELLDHMIDWCNREIDDITGYMANGHCSDFAHYRWCSGRITALKMLLDEIKDRENLLLHDEEVH